MPIERLLHSSRNRLVYRTCMPTIVICSPTLEWTPYLCARQRAHMRTSWWQLQRQASACLWRNPLPWTWPRSTERWPQLSAPVCRSRSGSTDVGIPLLPGYGRLWRMAPWARYISCTSSAVIPPRHRFPTCSPQAVCSPI